jgi:hypothetical protein
MNTITFNLPTYQKFKKEYQNAINSKKQIFIFDGNELLTDYAKYVIEYLKPTFEN